MVSSFIQPGLSKNGVEIKRVNQNQLLITILAGEILPGQSCFDMWHGINRHEGVLIVRIASVVGWSTAGNSHELAQAYLQSPHFRCTSLTISSATLRTYDLYRSAHRPPPPSNPTNDIPTAQGSPRYSSLLQTDAAA